MKRLWCLVLLVPFGCGGADDETLGGISDDWSPGPILFPDTLAGLAETFQGMDAVGIENEDAVSYRVVLVWADSESQWWETTIQEVAAKETVFPLVGLTKGITYWPGLEKDGEILSYGFPIALPLDQMETYYRIQDGVLIMPRRIRVVNSDARSYSLSLTQYFSTESAPLQMETVEAGTVPALGELPLLFLPRKDGTYIVKLKDPSGVVQSFVFTWADIQALQEVHLQVVGGMIYSD